MKKIVFTLGTVALLFACNSGEAPNAQDPATAENTTESTDTATAEDSVQWQDIASDEALVATALLAAPEASRAACTVIGYNMAGEFVTLKEGSNEFICLADDPKKDGFNAACYHQSLEPFMARGRALKAEGKTADEIFDIREAEVKAGKLSMGDPGAALHIYYGKQARYDPASAKVDEAIYRYVVYLPFATAASTGLPESPIAPNHPWIMNPGTHRAHIMISPINKEMEGE